MDSWVVACHESAREILEREQIQAGQVFVDRVLVLPERLGILLINGSTDLNVEAFSSTIASESIRNQILDSIAAGYGLQIFGTPTFLVNGTLVHAGSEGKNLDAAIAKTLPQ